MQHSRSKLVAALVRITSAAAALVVCFHLCAIDSALSRQAVDMESANDALDAQKGPTLGVALSTGGMAASSQLGVLLALEEHGIVVQYVGGVSMGCIIASLYATGRYSAEQLVNIGAGAAERMAHGAESDYQNRDIRLKVLGEGAPNFPVSMRDGFRNSTYATRILVPFLWPELRVSDFRALPRPLVCITTEYGPGSDRLRAVIHDSGSILDVLNGSSSIPFFYRPVWIRGEPHVDGGVRKSNVIAEVRALGADIVLGVDASRGLGQRTNAGQPVSGGADLVIEPDVDHIGRNDFSAFEEAVRAGYEAAIPLLDSIKALVGLPDNAQVPIRAVVPSGPVDVDTCEVHWGHLSPYARIGSRDRVKLLRLRAFIDEALSCGAGSYDEDRFHRVLDTLTALPYFDQVSFLFDTTEAHLVVNVVPAASRFTIRAGVGRQGLRGAFSVASVSPRSSRISRLFVGLDNDFRAGASLQSGVVGPLGIRGEAIATFVSSRQSAEYYLTPASQLWQVSAHGTLADARETMFEFGMRGAFSMRDTVGVAANDPTLAASVRLHVSREDHPEFPTSGFAMHYEHLRVITSSWWVHRFAWRSSVEVSPRVIVRLGLGLQYLGWARANTVRTGGMLPSSIRAFAKPLGGVGHGPFEYGEFVGVTRFGVLGSFTQVGSMDLQFGRRKWIGILRFNVAAVSEGLDGQLRPERAIFGGGLTLMRRTPIIPLSVTVGASNLDETAFARRSLQPSVDVSLNWRY